MTLTLNAWLEKEAQAGLEGMRLCVSPYHKPGITAEAVLKELLQAEQAIARGEAQVFSGGLAPSVSI